MASPTYLDQLDARLAAGLAKVPAKQLTPHREFIVASQCADGGFPNRAGKPDLYYTGFALRALAGLGAITPVIRDRVSGFIRQQPFPPTGIIDWVSLLYAARIIRSAGGPDVLLAGWRRSVVAALEKHRSPDGGYAKAAGGSVGSTYHTFLAALACEMMGEPPRDPKRVVAFLKSRRRDDGGFVEWPVMKRSGTNPTAAALGLGAMLARRSATVSLLGRASGVAKGAARCLLALQTVDGGFRANSVAPAADLLSTFTALLTLDGLGALDRADGAAASRFVRSLALPAGGFRGGAWDDRADVEYTFYGLGSLSLLA
jgi:geranylgeranyl transferase type-2 subunit beta